MAGDNSLKSSKEQVSNRPIIDEAQAIKLSQQFFGLQATVAKELDSFGDRNFYLKGKRQQTEFGDGELAASNEEREFVLKILNHVDSADVEFVDAQDIFSLFLKKKGFECPVPLHNLKNGDYKVMWKNPRSRGLKREGATEAVRLLTFVSGTLLKHVAPLSPDLLYNTGQYVARFDKVAQKFSHPGIEHRVYNWDLQHFEKIEHYVTNFDKKDDEDSAELLEFVYERFREEVLPRLPATTKQIIHNDFNENNILVTLEAAGHRVSGILDFGDMCFSYRTFEVAICMAHMIMTLCEAGQSYSRAIRGAGHVLNGYHETFPLSHVELDLVYWSAAARICQIVSLGQYQSLLDPSNVYLQSGLKIGKEVLRHYVQISQIDMMNIWSSQKSEGQAIKRI